MHSLPSEEKEALKMHHHNKSNTNRYRGLAPILANDPSHKELFDMGYPYRLASENQKGFKLVEETPFPKSEQYKNI